MSGRDPAVLTPTGTLAAALLLVPSWPDALRPQQYADPEVLTPHVWLPPGATLAKTPEDAPALTCTIFPNPSAGLIQVEWDFLFKREALLESHDLSGKLIFKQLCPSFQQNIQIDGTLWEKGTYVLTIQGEQQRISTLFIIN